MTTDKSPEGAQDEALKLADVLERDLCDYPCEAVALVLRRLHADNQALRARVQEVGAAAKREHARVQELERAVPQWQPIETAPKDEPVLLRLGNVVGSGMYRQFCISHMRAFCFDGATLPSGATHWMPLPAPPQASARGAKGESNDE